MVFKVPAPISTGIKTALAAVRSLYDVAVGARNEISGRSDLSPTRQCQHLCVVYGMSFLEERL